MKYVGLTIAVCLLALTAFVPGCGKKPAPTSNVTSTQPETPPPAEGKSPPPPPGAKAGKDEKPPEFRDILQDQIGMPVYPGAKQKSFRVGGDGKGNKVVVASLTTSDSFDKVMVFYRESLLGYKVSKETRAKGSRMSGFYKTAGKKSDLILIEGKAGIPTKIDVSVTTPLEQ